MADGRPIPLKQLSKLRKGRFVVALDGAAERCKKENWCPDLILGDFDQISAVTLEFFRRKNIPILKVLDQNFTDSEKGLQWLIKNKFLDICFIQAWGERIDHSLANLSFLKKFSTPTLKIEIHTAQSRILYLQNTKFISNGKAQRGFGIMPFPKCKVWSSGLEFEMQGKNLRLGKNASSSNRTLRKKVALRIQGAALVMDDL